MSGRPTATDQAGAPPLVNSEVVFAVLGVMAFVTGVTKRWILDPLGEAFDSLAPSSKAAVAVLVVVAVAGAIALARLRRRRAVMAADRTIERYVAG